MRKANRKKLRENRLEIGQRRSGGACKHCFQFLIRYTNSWSAFQQMVLDLKTFPKSEMSVKTGKGNTSKGITFHRDEAFHLNCPRNYRVFHTNGKCSCYNVCLDRLLQHLRQSFGLARA